MAFQDNFSRDRVLTKRSNSCSKANRSISDFSLLIEFAEGAVSAEVPGIFLSTVAVQMYTGYNHTKRNESRFMFEDFTVIRSGRKTGRFSSWDTSGRNGDAWRIPAGESRILADIGGPGRITHIWMTQPNHYREVLLRITWDNAATPSVLVPLGDFFCLGHGLVTSHQSALFSTSTRFAYQFEKGCALNCYIPMPFRERALVELVNESSEEHVQYFYIDYETGADAVSEGAGYLHAEFRRTNPFGGWGPEIASNRVGSHLSNIANLGEDAWRNNYVILDTKGTGHYIGCNISVTNFRGDWWGEGDDMIWVDGYKWPPDLHGTGSEDYLGQAYGMHDNAHLRCGSSVFEGRTLPGIEFSSEPWNIGGHQTSYVFHLENPVRFCREIKVTMEHGHGNHLNNEMSSVAYWYASQPCATVPVPPVSQRKAVVRDARLHWLNPAEIQCPGPTVELNEEMSRMKRDWAAEFEGKYRG